MNVHLLCDWALAAVATRVFGADVRTLLRRLAAVQVKAGISELARDRGTGQGEAR